MTISSTTNRVSYAGNGSTTVFSFPYYFLANADITVILKVDATGVETVKTLTTHYTLSGAGNQAGGSVTMLTAPASGETLVIYRDPDFTQTTDLTENDPLPAETVEAVFDKAVMISQRLQDQLDNSLKLPDGESADMTLPTAVDRANGYLAFDSTGLPIASAGTSDTTPISVYGATLVDDANAAAARSTLGIADGGANKVLGMNSGATAPEYKTVTAGTGIAVTHGTGTVTIAQSTIAMTVQRFTSGSGTYTTPAGVTRIKIKMCGGGGGGAGGGTSAGAGGNGGNTTFGSSLLTANGGTGGAVGGGAVSAGGSTTVNSPAIGYGVTGGQGQGGATVGGAQGGQGGANPFGGAGGGGNTGGTAGSGAANTGAGGGGGATNGGSLTGAGGGAGGYIEAIINSPSATYAYAVGAAGTVGTAGTGGASPGAGAAGVIFVEEFYL